MAYTLENSVLNGVLCYLSTSRNAVPFDSIVSSTVAYYTSETIKCAKELIYKICKEVPTNRKACASHPNPATADVKDILTLLEKQEEKNVELPSFYAKDASSLPPSSGFDSIAVVMCSMRDEVTSLRQEVSQLRQATQNDFKAIEGVSCVIQDVADIKTLLHAQRQIPSPSNLSREPSHVVASNDNMPSGSNTDGVPQNLPSIVHNGDQNEPSDAEDMGEPWRLAQSRNARRNSLRSVSSRGSNAHAGAIPRSSGNSRERGGGAFHGGAWRGGGGRIDAGRGGAWRGGGGRDGAGRGDAGRGGAWRDGAWRGGDGRGGIGRGGPWQRGDQPVGTGGSEPEHGSAGRGGTGLSAAAVSTGRPGASVFGPQRSRNIVGTGLSSGAGLTGVQRVFELFVGGCALDTTEREITMHCQEKGVSIRKCEMLNTKSEWYKPFKVSVNAVDREKVLDAAFWPESIFVRKFQRPRGVRD